MDQTDQAELTLLSEVFIPTVKYAQDRAANAAAEQYLRMVEDLKLIGSAVQKAMDTASMSLGSIITVDMPKGMRLVSVEKYKKLLETYASCWEVSITEKSYSSSDGRDVYKEIARSLNIKVLHL